MSKLDEMFTCNELGEGFKPVKKSKEMSKDRIPEVGDIWEDSSGYKVLILKTFISYSEAISENFYYRIIYNKGCAKKDYKDISSCDYIGKSKVNVDDLFKTENEE